MELVTISTVSVVGFGIAYGIARLALSALLWLLILGSQQADLDTHPQ